ncbi:sodium channel protein Nach-like [Cylas formicarius]|uniref:sodium channel protein Nach-like n=1 Tax=Cylas formicarius TaxID=197179 RepID=UPI0029583712|nr:sodium channel protein Nach-like [Cylas formicarius]
MALKSDSLIRSFFSTTTFHGFKFLCAERLHWTERLFWVVCCAFSWFASVVLMNSAWYSFQNNAISFVVETNYLDWDTEFPSVSVCETDNQKRMTEFTDKLFGDPHDYNLDEVVKEAAFFKGLFFFTLEICGPNSPPDPNCFKRTLSDYANELKSSCNELFNRCAWNDVEFDCCLYFKELRTDLGYCYVINNLQTKDRNGYRMVSNKKSGPGTLRLEINGSTNVYVLGEQEIPSLLTSPVDTIQASPNTRLRRYFTVKDIENQPEVKDLSIRQRKCRFPDENYLEVVPYYSYSGCLLQCKKTAQMEKCGCAHHLVPNTPIEKRCNITGLSCLNEHYREVTVLKPAWSDRVGLVCECLPSCTEIQLNVVRDYKESIAEDYAVVELALERLPTERYKRNVVMGLLDLVVSMGSAAALFLGASLLSFVELLYYLLIRAMTDYFRR